MSEEANEPVEIETVESRIVETGTMTETLGKDTETMTDLSRSDMPSRRNVTILEVRMYS